MDNKKGKIEVETEFKNANKKNIKKAWELTKKKYSNALRELGK